MRQHKLPPPAGSQVYELTDWGAELEPDATTWAAGQPLSVDAVRR